MTLGPQGGSDLVQVYGVGTNVASYIVQQLTKSVADMAVSGVTGVVIAFEEAQYEIRIVRRGVQARYRIRLREGVYGLFNDAMNRAESNSKLRADIRQRLIDDLNSDLDDIIEQIRDELVRSNRF